MKYLSILVSAFIPAFMVCACAQTHANADQEFASIPFQLLDGHVIVSVRINGQGPFSAIVDDGAQQTILDTQVANQIGLHPIGISAVSGVTQSSVQLFTSNLAGISIGGSLLTGQTLFVTDMAKNHLNAAGNAQMILGQALFTAYVVTIDFVNSKVELDDPTTYTAPSGAKILPVTIAPNGIPILTGTVDNAPGAFVVDLGSNGGLILYPSFVAQNKNALNMTAAVTKSMPEVGGTVTLTTLPTGADFQFGSVKGHIARLDLLSNSPPSAGDVEIDGNFGVQLWLNHIVTFDLSHKQIILQ